MELLMELLNVVGSGTAPSLTLSNIPRVKIRDGRQRPAIRIS